MNSRAILATALLFLPLFLVGPSPPQPAVLPVFPHYTVTDLGMLPGDDQSFAWGLNEAGAVVGASSGPAGMRAFVWTREGGMVPLPCPSGRPLCTARDINDAGQAVGSAWMSPVDVPGHAIRWDAGAPRDLGTLGTGLQSEAWGVNDEGVVVGYSWTGSGLGPHAFAWDDARGMIDLSPGSLPGYAYDINDLNQRAGHQLESDGYHAYVWGDGTATDLGGLAGAVNTYISAVNSDGIVAGYARSSSGNERIVRSTPGGILENLGGVYDWNRAWGINRAGYVVGEGRFLSGPVRAIMYTDSNGLQDLHLYVKSNPGWFLRIATDINDAGAIVGYGTNLDSGRTHAFLLSPPERVAAPHGMYVSEGISDAVHLAWTAVPHAEGYRVFTSTDRFAPFPWPIAGTTSDTWFDLPGHRTDGVTHYYIVRAVAQGLEGPNSTMGAKIALELRFQEGRTNVAWFSLPYHSAFQRASDLASFLGPERADVLGKWDPSSQSSDVYYYARGAWRGEDFPLAAGDGLYLGIRASFSLVLLGTDSPATLTHSRNSALASTAVWLGLPFTSVYRRAADVATELGPSRILEVGRWDLTTQSTARWSWNGGAWTGSDFALDPGDGVYVVLASDFAWIPTLVTPALD